MRFLIVEDHVGMADQLSRGFAARDLGVKVVANGEERGVFCHVHQSVARKR